MRPILTRSEITDAVYIVTKYKILEGGVVDAIEKRDVTNQFDAMTEPLRAENAKLRDACNRLIQTVLVAESVSDCGLLDKRFEGELRDMGFEV